MDNKVYTADDEVVATITLAQLRRLNLSVEELRESGAKVNERALVRRAFADARAQVEGMAEYTAVRDAYRRFQTLRDSFAQRLAANPILFDAMGVKYRIDIDAQAALTYVSADNPNSSATATTRTRSGDWVGKVEEYLATCKARGEKPLATEVAKLRGWSRPGSWDKMLSQDLFSKYRDIL